MFFSLQALTARQDEHDVHREPLAAPTPAVFRRQAGRVRVAPLTNRAAPFRSDAAPTCTHAPRCHCSSTPPLVSYKHRVSLKTGAPPGSGHLHLSRLRAALRITPRQGNLVTSGAEKGRDAHMS